MSTEFHHRIQKALANPRLSAALDANAGNRNLGRHQAYASLPEDVQNYRQRLHATRQEVIDHLEDHLERFVERCRENGIEVHMAKNSAEAIQIVLDIARASGAHLIAKSKSMVSEEVHLNPALEAAGIQVVETDLGEYIVQLRHEPPAHIITPAVHLRRDDVGRLFAEKLGIPYTEDIPTLTATARHVLRQVFLDADVGISGVNFGVVENGALCIVTNEGNGRMVTTLPQTHVALMGIERLVPDMKSLALVLEMLPRSATGQKLTVYTNLIRAPRQPGEVDGPASRHLILLDNGRRRLQASPLKDILLCIRCGACLNACPVFREIGGHAYVGHDGRHSPYGGPIGSVLSPGLFGVPEFGQLARASSLCGACKQACPVDIDLPKLLLRVRAGGLQIETHHTPPNVPLTLSTGLKLYNFFAVRAWLFAIAQKFAGFFGNLFSARQGWLRLPALTGWGYSKDFPTPALRPFSQQWAAGSVTNSPSTTPPSKNVPAPQTPASTPQPQSYGLKRFQDELELLGVNCTACHTDELPAHILSLLRSRGIDSLQAWESMYLPDGLLDDIRQAGVQICQQPDPKIQAGLTGALGGVAANGTLVLPGSPGRPLTASLLPDLHIAILEASAIYNHLEDALSLEQVKNTSTTVLVTGPSRTADIEMTLSIGVHGPKELQVFCLL